MRNKERYDRADIRKMNAVSVLNQLWLHGSLSRANIAAKLGLTRATVSSIISDLLDAQLVTETEFVAGSSGRPGLHLCLNPNAGSMLAVAIDLDRATLVLANFGQVTLWRKKLVFGMKSPSADVLPQVEALVEEALAHSQKLGVDCFGIGVTWAGLVRHDQGELAYGPLSGWEQVSLRSDWETRFEVPVYLENEAHAGAIGAHHMGSTRGVNDLVYLSLGLGLAAGVMVNGHLLRGKEGFAGQVGHTFFEDNGLTCGCGRKGCWVTEVGGAAIRRKFTAAGIEFSDEVDSVDAWVSVAHERGLSGDAAVLHVLEDVGRKLGKGLTTMVHVFNPSVVVVGGQFGRLLGLVEPVVREALDASTLPYMAESTTLILGQSGVQGDLEQGCLAIVFDAVMRNPIF